MYLAHVLKPDYSDAAFPFWRLRMEPGGGNRTHCVEGMWGAQIIDDLKPQEGEQLVEIAASTEPQMVVPADFGGLRATTVFLRRRRASVKSRRTSSSGKSGGSFYAY